MINRLARLRQQTQNEQEQLQRKQELMEIRGITDLRVDCRFKTKGRTVTVERISDDFELDKFAVDGRKVKRALPQRVAKR